MFVLRKKIVECESPEVKNASFVLNVTNAKRAYLLNKRRNIRLHTSIAVLVNLHQASTALFDIGKPEPDTPRLQFFDVYNTGDYWNWEWYLAVGYYNGPIITILVSLISSIPALSPIAPYTRRENRGPVLRNRYCY